MLDQQWPVSSSRFPSFGDDPPQDPLELKRALSELVAIMPHHVEESKSSDGMISTESQHQQLKRGILAQGSTFITDMEQSTQVRSIYTTRSPTRTGWLPVRMAFSVELGRW